MAKVCICGHVVGVEIKSKHIIYTGIRDTICCFGLLLVVDDTTGHIECIKWMSRENLSIDANCGYTCFALGDLINAKGRISHYRGAVQINIDSISKRTCIPSVI